MYPGVGAVVALLMTAVYAQNATEADGNVTPKIDEPRGRSLNFTSSSAKDEFGDLSDVSMDHDNQEDNNHNFSEKMFDTNTTLGICVKGGLTYENGEKLESGCDQICTCENGKMDCVDRCRSPFVRRDKKLDDPLCTAKDAEDSCCAILVCAQDTETEPLEICSYNNKTYNRGEHFNKDCSEICTCEAAGKLSCKPRCNPTNKTSDRCVEVPDPADPCCKTILCDVTLEDHEPEKEDYKQKITSAKLLNSTTIKIKFDSKLEQPTTVELSSDRTNWKSFKTLPGGFVRGFKEDPKYIKLEDTEDVIDILRTSSFNGDSCSYKGNTYKLDEEFNDGCESLCVCKSGGVRCLALECPTYFGVDVLDATCVEWETVPPDFKPEPPECCPRELRCKSNGSCEYQGETYHNWQMLPSNVTGCEKKCYCEMGKVECQGSCPPVPAVPPQDLHCPPQMAVLRTLQDDDCCKYWVCRDEDEEGPQQNETKSDKKGPKIKTKPTEIPLLQATKSPSKIFGPLVVYGNDEDNNKPIHVSPDENPFYNKDKENKKKTSDVVANKTTQFLGPINPDFDSKPNKNSKPKNKPQTKPNSVATTNDEKLNHGQTEPPRIQIHAKGNPDEILQYINQHPDLNNYPPGSVIEITNVNPHDNLQRPLRPQFVNQQQIIPFQQPIQGLPPGITLEQILQEIQKSEQLHPTVPVNPYQQPNLIYPQNTGQIYLGPQNGPYRTNATAFPGQLYPGVNIPDYHHPQEEISVQSLEAVDAHTVRLTFDVPRIYVGLLGRVEVRYTSERDENIENWELQMFAPPNDVIDNHQLMFDLLNLKPDTEYKLKIMISLKDLHNTPSSRIYTVRTLKEIQMTTLPPIIPIEPNLAISDVNSSWANVIWRKFTEYEMQFVDGVQLRYKEIDGKIYAATPLIHRAVTSYTLEGLKPNTKYELGIYFIPFPGQVTELHANHMVHFTTANEVDTYGFNVTLEVTHVKPTSVEISWSGVPYPEDKYVYIYRAIYQSDNDKGDYSTFKVAKRDSPAKTMIMGLKPGTRYRLWLEVYLTNGKIKTSNVQDFVTKPRSAGTLDAQQDKLAFSEYPDHKGDYYGPLVVVAILAAIAIVSTLILLLVLVRRHGQNKASITPPSRVSQSAYDNPTYKVEIQQETMGL